MSKVVLHHAWLVLHTQEEEEEVLEWVTICMWESHLNM